MNNKAFFEGNVESKCHLWRGKGWMQSVPWLLGCVAKSDQGEAGLGIQMVLEIAPRSSATSPRFWTLTVPLLIFLGPCFPKQINSFSMHKWHVSCSYMSLELLSKSSSGLQRLCLNPKHLSNQRGRWFLESAVSPGWGGNFWEESVGLWVKMAMLCIKVHNENDESQNHRITE